MKYFDKWVLTNGEPPKTNVLWVKPTDEDGVKGAEINAFIDGEWRTASSNSGGGGGDYPPEGGVPKSDLSEEVQASLNKADNAQEELISGENIKTINGESILGEGNITISGGGAVNSVNGKTGEVVLDAEDVGAYKMPASGIPASDLASGVQDVLSQVATNTQNISANAQDIATLQAAYAGLTQSDIIVGALPASGVANTIYRVPGTSSYSDYMWNGSQFVLLATYSDVPLSMNTTAEGLYFVDIDYNIGAYIDNTGFHAINLLEFEKL